MSKAVFKKVKGGSGYGFVLDREASQAADVVINFDDLGKSSPGGEPADRRVVEAMDEQALRTIDDVCSKHASGCISVDDGRLEQAAIVVAQQTQRIRELESCLIEQLEAFAETLSTHPHRIGRALEGASKDEIAIAVTFVEKLMGEGRTEHGALDLAADERDLLGEASDELDDVIGYLMFFRRRLEILRMEQ